MADEPSEQEVTAWLERSATGLRSVGDNRAVIIAVFERFLDEGMALIYSPSAMWDYVSMVIRRAGFDESQRDRRMRIFSTVRNQRFHGGRPYPPDWPWNVNEDAEPHSWPTDLRKNDSLGTA